MLEALNERISKLENEVEKLRREMAREVKDKYVDYERLTYISKDLIIELAKLDLLYELQDEYRELAI